MVVISVITIIRHRQQKFSAEQKELEYLRYFHSILPHSQIYGNLNEKFSKLDRRKNSRNGKRNSKRQKLEKADDTIDSENKLNGLTTMYRQFRYSQYSSRTISNDTDNPEEDSNALDDSEMIELIETAASNTNGPVVSAVVDKADHNTSTGKVCQKFNFMVVADNMQDVTVQVEKTDKEMNNMEKGITEEIKDSSTDKSVHKSKTESANHRVHFCLEQDRKKREQTVYLTTAGSSASSGTPTQVELHAENNWCNRDAGSTEYTGTLTQEDKNAADSASNTGAGSTALIGTPTQVELHAPKMFKSKNNNIFMKQLLMDEIDNMKVTKL